MRASSSVLWGIRFSNVTPQRSLVSFQLLVPPHDKDATSTVLREIQVCTFEFAVPTTVYESRCSVNSHRGLPSR